MLTANAGAAAQVRVNPGKPEEAEAYYNDVITKLRGFPQARLQDSRIGDMLVYYGFPALLANDIEKLDPAVLMDFEKLSSAVSNRSDFAVVYRNNPLRPGEIVASRFFAPKIINVRDPQVNGVPVGGFGWRKVLRFRARTDSKARAAGLDYFFLLFNFATQTPKFPAPGIHAGQLQGILQPIYPTGGNHRDLYFLVYERLDAPQNPERVGTFLVATFDLAGFAPDDKYYVPRACAQCHGSESTGEPGAKVNYLDTDHWIDRTGDDFRKVSADDVLVDGVRDGYGVIRTLNTDIAKQNAAVGTSTGFALLATQKWLELHKVGGADETRHVPPIRRGFVARDGDATWTNDISKPDPELIPQLNTYCFRCHSSVRFHVFQKTAVIQRKQSITSRLQVAQPENRFRMPQDRVLGSDLIAKLVALMNRL